MLNPYWRKPQREALLRRLEMAVEARVLWHSQDAMDSWNREVPKWWRDDRTAYVRICSAWDRRIIAQYDDYCTYD